MTTEDAAEFLVELISQLFHADELITEQAKRIEVLEAEVCRLRAAVGDSAGAAACAAAPGWISIAGESGACSGSDSRG